MKHIRRADIYQKVADKVNYYLDTGDYPQVFEFKDSEGIERSVNVIAVAESLKGKITRSLVKRNTMTFVYSVTFRGMEDQLRAELEDLKFKGKAFWDGELWIAVRLLATLNLKAIKEVVNGAVLGQEYLKECSGTLNTPARWLTPLYGLPVLQPVFKKETHQVRTLLGRLKIEYFTDDLDTRSQRNAIAPNVIHSLDSTILFGTVERYPHRDIGTIHDCFLGHPNNWKQMQEAFKDSYIALMEASPLEYIGRQLDIEGTIEVPKIGTLDLSEVKNAKYIIS